MCIKELEKAQSYPDTIFHLWDDCSQDETSSILNESTLPKVVHVNEVNMGLRDILISFIKQSKSDFLSVVGNDCLMPPNWLKDILTAFETTKADILSPNVFPSNAAFTHGREDKDNLGYRPSRIVGGLWTMRRSMVEGVHFEDYKVSGITGAFNILSQIITEKEPKIGWLPNITVQDMGYWGGNHPLHIKSDEHREYSAAVNRKVSW